VDLCGWDWSDFDGGDGVGFRGNELNECSLVIGVGSEGVE
jgi:hypothetical protein